MPDENVLVEVFVSESGDRGVHEQRIELSAQRCRGGAHGPAHVAGLGVGEPVDVHGVPSGLDNEVAHERQAASGDMLDHQGVVLVDPSLSRSLETASVQRFPCEGVIGDPGVCVNRGAAWQRRRAGRVVRVVGTAGR